MTKEELKTRGFEKEINFVFSKSGGKGGQHVNKTESKATLLFSVKDSKLLSDAEKKTILIKLKSRVSGEGNLIISDESSRSQHSNREKALNKFFSLLVRTLQKRKVRKATSPTSSSKEKRMQEKKRKKEIKQLRNSTRFD